MNARRVNLVLWTAAGLLTTAAAVTLVAAVSWPLELASGNPSGHATSRPAAASAQSLDEYAAIWSRSYRQVPSNVAPASVVAPAEQGPGLALAGTVGHTVALLKMPDGTVHVRSIGEKLADAEVISIEPYKVTLRQNGQTVTLTKPPPTIAERIR
jgi:hypothetical protein